MGSRAAGLTETAAVSVEVAVVAVVVGTVAAVPAAVLLLRYARATWYTALGRDDAARLEVARAHLREAQIRALDVTVKTGMAGILLYLLPSVDGTINPWLLTFFYGLAFTQLLSTLDAWFQYRARQRLASVVRQRVMRGLSARWSDEEVAEQIDDDRYA